MGWRPGARTQTQPYQRLFRGDTHLEHSYPPPQAQCKASSGDTHTAFVIAVVSRTGKYAFSDPAPPYWPSPAVLPVPAELWAALLAHPGTLAAWTPSPGAACTPTTHTMR